MLAQLNALSAENLRLQQQAEVHLATINSRYKAPKIPAPDKYSGPPNDARAFVAKLQSYLKYCLNDEERIEHAVNLLSGNAYKWHTVHGRTVTDWNDWCAALKSYGTDPRKHENAVSKLRGCRQNSRKVQRYISDFTTICLDLDLGRGWTELSLMDLFLEGLDNQVRSHVEARGKPATLLAAQEAANIASGESFTAYVPNNNNNNNKAGPSNQNFKQVRFQKQGATPMDIGSVNVQSDKKTWPPPHAPAKPCPICGKGGHWSVQCPTVKSAQSN